MFNSQLDIATLYFFLQLSAQEDVEMKVTVMRDMSVNVQMGFMVRTVRKVKSCFLWSNLWSNHIFSYYENELQNQAVKYKNNIILIKTSTAEAVPKESHVEGQVLVHNMTISISSANFLPRLMPCRGHTMSLHGCVNLDRGTELGFLMLHQPSS